MVIERIFRWVGLVLGNGYVLFFFSERLFWSMWRPGDEIGSHVAAWLLYSFLGYLLLATIRHFRVHDVWGLLLAGAFFGWLGEGVYAMTLFGDPSMPFPVTIAWTGLAWHAPITVVLGWYGLRRALLAQSLRPTVWMSCGFGAFWGFWALGWSRETPPITAAPLDFFVHAAVATAALALSQRAITAGTPQLFRPSRAGLIVAIGIVLVFFGLVTVPAIPHAPLIIFPLFVILFFALRRNQVLEQDTDVLSQMTGPVKLRNAAGLIFIPITATFFYSGLTTLGVSMASHQIIAVVTTITGSALFVIAVYRVTRWRCWFRRTGRATPRGVSE